MLQRFLWYINENVSKGWVFPWVRIFLNVSRKTCFGLKNSLTRKYHAFFFMKILREYQKAWSGIFLKLMREKSWNYIFWNWVETHYFLLKWFDVPFPVGENRLYLPATFATFYLKTERNEHFHAVQKHAPNLGSVYGNIFLRHFPSSRSICVAITRASNSGTFF